MQMNPINTALLSFGMSGQLFHAPFLHVLKEFNLYAVWERTKNIAQQKFSGVKVYRTLEELLADDAIELVVVNTPTYTHYQYAKKALFANKHVVVEKPFTVKAEEGEELIALAKKKKRILSVYQNRRYDSDYRTIKRMVAEGALGEIVEAEFHFDRYRIELSPKIHKESPGPGTGNLYDLGSHIIDQALQLFGKPQAVFADIRIIRPQSKVPDYFEVLLYYQNLRVRLHSSYLVREPIPSYILHGTKGSFIKVKTDVQENALSAGLLPGGEDWGKEPDAEQGFLHTEVDGQVLKKYVTSERGNYGDYYAGIYDAVRKNAPVPVRAEDGLAVIKIITAAMESSEQKGVVDL